MSEFLVAYLSSLVAFVAIDFCYLGFMAPRFYRPRLELMGAKVRWRPAIAFYLIYALGVTLLVVLPSLGPNAGARALFDGAVLGLVCYATYNLTNWATLKHWSGAVAYVDIAWGAVLTAVACWIGVTVTAMI